MEDTCADLCLAFISFAIIHIATMANSWNASALWSIKSMALRHVLASELGLVLVWGVLVTLFRQLSHLVQTSWEARHNEWSLEFQAIALTTLVTVLAVTLRGIGMVSPPLLLGAALLNLGGSFGRLAWKQRASRSHCTESKGAKLVLIAGAGELGQQVATYLTRHKQNLRVVKGFLDQDRSIDTRVLGRIDDLSEIARAEFADEIIVAMPDDREMARTAIIEALRNHLDVRIVAERIDGYTAQGSDPLPIFSIHEEPLPQFGLLAKRALDVSFACVALIGLAPLLALIALAIRLDSSGPVLYRAPRVGKKGIQFLCYKFRTMVADADRAKEILRPQNERRGPIFKLEHDPRITRMGHFLRRYSLDELPQLWNVVRGEMSLVGPRPHPVDDYLLYDLPHLRRLDVTPGITGLWQISARRDPSFNKNMELDLEYIDQWSLWEDIKILARTVGAVLAGTGV